jgi:hypothetical protein
MIDMGIILEVERDGRPSSSRTAMLSGDTRSTFPSVPFFTPSRARS